MVSGFRGMPRADQASDNQVNVESVRNDEENADGKPQLASHARAVVLSDEELVAMAIEAKESIAWRRVILSARHGPERWQREEMVNGFTLYARHEPQRFAMLAVGLVPGCVAEVLNVLDSPTSERFAQRMQAIFASEFRDAAIVHSVDRHESRSAEPMLSKDGAELVDLKVKRLTFNKAHWLANPEEWCYLNAVYRGHHNTVAEKLLTTMQAKDILADASSAGRSSVSTFHNVVAGYLLRAGMDDQSISAISTDEIDDAASPPQIPRVTRVCFYAEYQVPRRGGFSIAATKGWQRSVEASDRTIKLRLLKLGHSTARLTTLVRRQRLGLQVLADATRFFPPSHVPCHVCTRMLVFAKLCRVCGNGVCGDCSAKHERARQPRGRSRLEVTQIRVCAHCIKRIDQAEYTQLSASSLVGAHVTRDPPGTKSASAKLRCLLQETLATADAPSRKESVRRLIQSVLSVHDSSRPSDSPSSAALTASSPDRSYVEALGSLEVAQQPADGVALRSDDHRSYRIDTSGSLAVPTPVPEDEDLRLRSVQLMNGPELATVMELEVLCELAAREMGCATSAISLIDQDEYFGVASNAETLRKARIPRTQTICSHTMMEKHLPMLVSHPEADIRFSKFDSVREFGVRFYCAFPLIGEHDQVIGTMCCVHGHSIQVTESQIATFKRLALTAARVMRVETRKRRRKESATSSTS